MHYNKNIDFVNVLKRDEIKQCIAEKNRDVHLFLAFMKGI